MFESQFSLQFFAFSSFRLSKSLRTVSLKSPLPRTYSIYRSLASIQSAFSACRASCAGVFLKFETSPLIYSARVLVVKIRPRAPGRVASISVHTPNVPRAQVFDLQWTFSPTQNPSWHSSYMPFQIVLLIQIILNVLQIQCSLSVEFHDYHDNYIDWNTFYPGNTGSADWIKTNNKWHFTAWPYCLCLNSDP